MTTSLTQLFKQSFQFCISRWKPLLIGALLFGTLSAIVFAVTNRSIEGAVQQTLQNAGFNEDQMIDIRTRLQNGDEAAMQEAMNQMDAFQKKIDAMSPEERDAYFAKATGTMLRKAAPALVMRLALSAIVSLLAMTYYFLFALKRGDDAVDILGGVPHSVLSLLGVYVWAFLRSFAWIPLLGLIPAVILGPRFCLAPVILLTEKKGIRACVQQSYVRTQGYWGTIVGYGVVAGLAVFFAMVVLSVLTRTFMAVTPVLGLLYASVLAQLGMAFMTVFIVGLSKTILEHPMKTAS